MSYCYIVILYITLLDYTILQYVAILTTTLYSTRASRSTVCGSFMTKVHTPVPGVHYFCQLGFRTQSLGFTLWAKTVGCGMIPGSGMQNSAADLTHAG